MNESSLLWPGPTNCGENKTLKMNECCLDIFSDTGPSRLYTRSSECFECNFSVQKPVIEPYKIASFILNTDYPLEFYIEHGTNKQCSKTYWFGNMGKYAWNVSYGLCSDIQIQDEPESIWLNFGVIFSVFICLFLAYGLYKFVVTKCLSSIRCQVSFRELEEDLGNPDARDQNKSYMLGRTRRNSRIAALDAFRGITIFLMIFVNYGGGGYSFFKHSVWNGLTVADLVFPWFIWSMGVSVPITLRSKLRTSVYRRNISFQIMKRTLFLILIGLILNSGSKTNTLTNKLDSFSSLRIPGVLQRIGLTYCVVALTELVFTKPQRNEQFGPWNICADIADSTIQWLIALASVIAHELITFLLPVPDCPTGYLGPGGWHEHMKYENCTGGAAGFIDRLVLTNNHLYQHPSFGKIYHTRLPYDPEGILGTLTCIFCAFLGVHAGRIILCYENSLSRIRRWLIWGLLLALIGGLLCNFFKNDGFVPVNKNLWSISYVSITSSLAFILFSSLYWLIDYRRICNGSPFLYAGMNALALYIGHIVFKKFFPFYWKPYTQTHGELLGMNLIAAFLWLGIAYIMYRRNIFIVL